MLTAAEWYTAEEPKMPAGYSGTPLATKLGVKTGQRNWRMNMPPCVAAEIAQSGLEPTLVGAPHAGLEMGHIFVTQRSELAHHLVTLRKVLAPGGVLWVSWPKKAAKIKTDITEDVIRTEALPLGFVDVKVCAVDAMWSGLKLVIRKSER